MTLADDFDTVRHWMDQEDEADEALGRIQAAIIRAMVMEDSLTDYYGHPEFYEGVPSASKVKSAWEALRRALRPVSVQEVEPGAEYPQGSPARAMFVRKMLPGRHEFRALYGGRVTS